MPNRLRAFILYMVLVGLPLAGVAGALYLGERLEAPASVKGRWRVEAAAPCLAGLGETVSIAQSGPDLQLTFNGAAPTTVPGQVDGLRLTATDALGTLALEATLDQQRGAARLQGRLTAANCAGPEKWSATLVLAAEYAASHDPRGPAYPANTHHPAHRARGRLALWQDPSAARDR